MEEITLYKGLFDLLLWICIYLVLLPAFKPPFYLKRKNEIIGIALLLLFCLFPYWGGDYYHFRDSYEFIKAGGYSRFEEVYLWMITNLGYSYTFLRFVIWGSALTILLLSYKRVGEKFDLTLFLFGTLFVLRFSYARASLAMAILLLGMTILYKPFKKMRVVSFIMGLTITCSAVFIHRSAIIGVISVFSTMLLIKNSKYKIILLACFIPFLTFIVSYLVGNILDTSFSTFDAKIDGKIESYLTEQIAQRGIAARILDILLFTPMILSVIAFVLIVLNGQYNKFSKVEKAFACYVFVVVMISTGLALDFKHETEVIAKRICYFAMPANAIFLMSLKSRRIVRKLFDVIFKIALAASLYALLYSTYMGYNRM